jgi:hypothetical protein
MRGAPPWPPPQVFRRKPGRTSPLATPQRDVTTLAPFIYSLLVPGLS